MNRLCGRYKSETGGDVTSLDVCSRRHLVVIGDTRGHVTITRINSDGFEVCNSVSVTVLYDSVMHQLLIVHFFFISFLFVRF